MCILCQLSNLLVRRHGETLFTTEALVDNACGVPAAIFRSFSVLHMQQHLPLLRPSYRAPLHREKGTTDSYLFFFATPSPTSIPSTANIYYEFLLLDLNFEIDRETRASGHIYLKVYIFKVSKVLKLIDRLMQLT